MASKQMDKFIVFKKEDTIKYFSWSESVQLATLIKKLQQRRQKDGKSNNKYIVCNQDEPYAETVWQIILKGEAANEKESENQIKEKVN